MQSISARFGALRRIARQLWIFQDAGLIDEVVSKVHWGTQGYKRAKAFKSYRGTTIGLVVFVSIDVLLRSFVDGAEVDALGARQVKN